MGGLVRPCSGNGKQNGSDGREDESGREEEAIDTSKGFSRKRSLPPPPSLSLPTSPAWSSSYFQRDTILATGPLLSRVLARVSWPLPFSEAEAWGR